MKRLWHAAVAAVALSAMGTVVEAAFIVESRSTGQNFSSYQEIGPFADTSAKSTAAGLTAGIGARYTSANFAVVGLRRALFKLNATEAGLYEAFITSGNQTSRVTNAQVKVTSAAGTTTTTYNESGNTNAWFSLGSAQYEAGTATGVVEINNANGNSTGNNINVDSVKWELLVGRAANAGPADGATNVGTLNGSTIDAQLSWTGGTNATAFNVYFGTAANSLSLVSSAQGGTTYNLSGLAGETQYFWRVDSLAGANTASGQVLDFTTAAVPEPTSLALFGLAGAALMGRRRAK